MAVGAAGAGAEWVTGCLQGSRIPSSRFPTNFPLSPKSRIKNGCTAATLTYRQLPSKQPVVCSNHTGGVSLSADGVRADLDPAALVKRRPCTALPRTMTRLVLGAACHRSRPRSMRRSMRSTSRAPLGWISAPSPR